MKNKKGQLIPEFLAILYFGVISVIIITAAYFYFAMGNDYLVLPFYNATESVNFSTTISDAMGTTVENYQNTNLSIIDNVWFIAYLIISMMGYRAAYISRGLNYFSWVNMLMYGVMVLLFVASLFYVVINWWYTDILLNLFTNLAVNVPKFAFYVENYGFIFFLQAVSMLLINVVDFDIARNKQRKNKEVQSLEDEIV